MKPLDDTASQKAAAPEAPAAAAPAAAPAKEEKIDFTGVTVEPLFAEDVDFDTFSKSDFRAVDDGSGTDRTILSGIKAYYDPEDLIGRTLIAITNLPPKPMMGVESNGMLLSAVYEQNGERKLRLLIVDDHIPAGAKLH